MLKRIDSFVVIGAVVAILGTIFLIEADFTWFGTLMGIVILSGIVLVFVVTLIQESLDRRQLRWIHAGLMAFGALMVANVIVICALYSIELIAQVWPIDTMEERGFVLVLLGIAGFIFFRYFRTHQDRPTTHRPN